MEEGDVGEGKEEAEGVDQSHMNGKMLQTMTYRSITNCSRSGSLNSPPKSYRTTRSRSDTTKRHRCKCLHVGPLCLGCLLAKPRSPIDHKAHIAIGSPALEPAKGRLILQSDYKIVPLLAGAQPLAKMPLIVSGLGEIETYM